MSSVPWVDRIYWIAMGLVGVWLILYFWVRPAAICAITLIIFKWLALNYTWFL